MNEISTGVGYEELGLQGSMELRRMSKHVRLLVWALWIAAFELGLVARPHVVLACACCADPGDRNIGTRAFEDQYRELIMELKFSSSASIYQTPAGLEVVQGISRPSEAYTISVTRGRDIWVFAFKDEKGRGGNLRFQLPARMDYFEVDQRDGDPGVDTQLYKEWRLFSKVVGDGIFAQAAGSLTLILHGRGNHCHHASQFRHWTLAANGPSTRFMFLGMFELRE